MDKTLTHDIFVSGRYYTSLFGASPAQVRACLFYVCAELGTEDAVAKVAGTDEIADTIANYPDGDEGVELDNDFLAGDKYPDPTDSMNFDIVDDEISDLMPDMDFDGDLVDHFYNLFGDRSKPATPADFR